MNLLILNFAVDTTELIFPTRFHIVVFIPRVQTRRILSLNIDTGRPLFFPFYPRPTT